MPDLQPARSPTFYFIGVTTGQSSIMKVFPKWAKVLGIEAKIMGLDLPIHASPQEYRNVVEFLKTDPLSLGALVTTHKLDLFKACRDIFDYIDPFAEELEEVSCLSKRNGLFRAHAKDPVSSGMALECFVPQNFWADHGGEVLLLGAGGSSLAMSLYFSQEKFAGNMPSRITIANRSEPRLVSARAVLQRLSKDIEFRFFVLSIIPITRTTTALSPPCLPIPWWSTPQVLVRTPRVPPPPTGYPIRETAWFGK
ncbi:MAG: hypothetical protein LBB68_10055 [Treponema sp.]|nr:hypothetical protein [Treponema sp.]